MQPEINVEIYIPSEMTMEDRKKRADEIIEHMEGKYNLRYTLKFNIVFA